MTNTSGWPGANPAGKHETRALQCRGGGDAERGAAADTGDPGTDWRFRLTRDAAPSSGTLSYQIAAPQNRQNRQITACSGSPATKPTGYVGFVGGSLLVDVNCRIDQEFFGRSTARWPGFRPDPPDPTRIHQRHDSHSGALSRVQACPPVNIYIAKTEPLAQSATAQPLS